MAIATLAAAFGFAFRRGEPTETAVELTPAVFTVPPPDDLDSLGYRELQGLAKQYAIPARQCTPLPQPAAEMCDGGGRVKDCVTHHLAGKHC